MIEVTIDHKSMSKLVREFPRADDNGVHWVAQAYLREAVKAAPQDKGSTRSSMAVRRIGQAHYTVSVNARADDGAPYPIFQEFGTGMKSEDWNGAPLGTRHMIYPRKAKFMRWIGKDGEPVFRRSVAGVPATHFMRNALDEVRPRIGDVYFMGFQQRI